MILNPGTVLNGRYKIIEKIGSGGMAVVYRGKDEKLDRYVTVKVLREEFIGDEEFIERFRSEACSAARLSHPNIVRAYDVGEDGEVCYIVNEYIHGDTLKKAIKEKAPFDSRSTINVAIQIASALSQAHKAHIVHRDIKPQNILVGTDGVVKVTDFGIARAATASTMTTTANAAGSVHYFSPEQARGGYVDEKSDIYSLGITMFEMITGVLPYQGNNSVSIALMHINQELPDIRQFNPNCSPSLEGIIKKATMKKADERYANIDMLLADLIRARADVAGEKRVPPVQKPAAKPLKAAQEEKPAEKAEGVRMSRRAEAAAQLRAQEKAAQAAAEAPQETKPADEKELEAIRAGKQSAVKQAAEEETVQPAPKESRQEKEEDADGDLYTPLVGFEKYSKKLPQISKEDAYESEYMKSEKVKTSRRPDKTRRNPRTEADYDNEYDRKTERKVILAAVLTALVIICIISVAGLRFLGGGFGGFGGFTAEEGGVETPLFIGVPYTEAARAAEDMGIVLVEEGSDYSSFYDTGYVIYQSVSEGTMIAEGTKIGVKVSLGLTEEEMPDVVGKDESDAKDAIIRLVGKVVREEYVNDSEAEPGQVIAQNPAAGEKITAKSHILLTISKGEVNTGVIVPNVVNETLESAKASLEAVGLVVGSVTEAESDTIAAGKVITQTLGADTEASSGSVVNLVVSKGSGKTEETAPPADQPTAPPADTGNAGNTGSTEGTKYFTIELPSGVRGAAYVRVVKNDADGVFPVVDEYRDESEFPYSISVTGRGSGTVTCYINDVQQWSQNVNFAG
ncbi:MAG: protein kinase [Bacillota bacterium]|nr:protein kinase [Bacillota bacterium]